MVRNLPALLREPGRRTHLLPRLRRNRWLRDILPTIRVPTLVLYRRDLREQMLDLAGRIKGARALEIEGQGFGAFGAMTREVEAFVSGMEAEPVPNTVLATVLFTDIVGSTERAAALGDRLA